MRILVTGASGMLGTDLVSQFQPFCHVAGIGRRKIDIPLTPYYQEDLTNGERISKILKEEKPEIIFHAAAMTNVDGCETQREQALKDNLEATKSLTQACSESGALLVFFSTDYVFDGSKKGEYEEKDVTRPLNYYGETKLLAENYLREKARRFIIFRTSWLYGLQGRSFPRTILEKTAQTKTLTVVSDQVGRPTYTRDIAAALSDLLKRDSDWMNRVNGETFHLANDGITSWFDFAKTILKLARYDNVNVEPVESTQFKRPAKRPLNSVLSLRKTESLLGIRMRHWQEAVRDFVQLLEKKEMMK